MTRGAAAITPQIEEQVVARLTKDPELHAVFPAAWYRADGSVLVYRDNLPGVRAQRHLYRRMIGNLEVADFLKRTCDEERCVNPFHYTKRRRSRAGLTACPKGHRYTKENTLTEGKLRCRTCRDAALARSQAKRKRSRLENPAAVNAAKTHCKWGHEFTEENTYHYGGTRQCRTCSINRARARNERLANERAERKAS